MSKAATESDLELLKRYVHGHAEEAFAEIVRRHLNLVYSSALRQVRSPQLAEEVAQSVFTDLAHNALKLTNDTGRTPVLTAWLYQVTRRTAIDVVRREARRQMREQIATEINAMNAATKDWKHIEPLLDEAVSELDEIDRAAVLLRYFENKSLREVGATLGTSDDAAQKRVSRAVERLREFFAKRGVTIGASGLTIVISANAIQAAPVGLALTISTATALTGTTLATTATVTATKAIAMTTMQKTLVTATVAVLAGVGIYEARQAAQLRDQVQTLQQQQALLTEQHEQLRSEREDATPQLAALREDSERLNRDTAELLKLRGEIGVARRQASDLEALKGENARLKSASKSSEAARFELPLRILELSDQFKLATSKYSAALQKEEQLAQDLNVPIEIATNASAFVHSSGVVSQYPSYFEALHDRDRLEALVQHVALRFANALLDAGTNSVGGSSR